MKAFVMLPLATVFGGKTALVDLRVGFDYDEESGLCKIEKIVGIVGKATYDFGHLYHTHETSLLNLIVNNKEHWNYEKVWYRPTTPKRLMCV